MFHNHIPSLANRYLIKKQRNSAKKYNRYLNEAKTKERERNKVVLEFLISCLLFRQFHYLFVSIVISNISGMYYNISLLFRFRIPHKFAWIKKKNQYVIKYKSNFLCACISLYVFSVYHATLQYQPYILNLHFHIFSYSGYRMVLSNAFCLGSDKCIKMH